MFDTFKNAWKIDDLRKRILFTLLIPSVIWLLNKALEVLGLLARKAEGGKHAS